MCWLVTPRLNTCHSDHAASSTFLLHPHSSSHSLFHADFLRLLTPLVLLLFLHVVDIFDLLGQGDGVEVQVTFENDRTTGERSSQGASKAAHKHILSCESDAHRQLRSTAIPQVRLELYLNEEWSYKNGTSKSQTHFQQNPETATHLSGRDSSVESGVSRWR